MTGVYRKVLSNIRDLFIKFVLIVVALMLVLTLTNFVAQYFELRPQSVLSYGILGSIITSNTLKLYDRFVRGYEEPLPNHVLYELEKSKKEIETMKEMLNNDERINITSDEIEVFAKGKLKKDEHNKERAIEKKKVIAEQSYKKDRHTKRGQKTNG